MDADTGRRATVTSKLRYVEIIKLYRSSSAMVQVSSITIRIAIIVLILKSKCQHQLMQID